VRRQERSSASVSAWPRPRPAARRGAVCIGGLIGATDMGKSSVLRYCSSLCLCRHRTRQLVIVGVVLFAFGAWVLPTQLFGQCADAGALWCICFEVHNGRRVQLRQYDVRVARRMSETVCGRGSQNGATARTDFIIPPSERNLGCSGWSRVVDLRAASSREAFGRARGLVRDRSASLLA